MTRELILAPEVEAEVERINQWWTEHRDKAPRLFLDELESAFRKIVVLPQIGRPYPGRSNIRSLVLPKTRFQVFYRSTSAQVHVVVIWSTRFGDKPPL